MKSLLAPIFSYLFMACISLLIISIFAVVIIFVRHIFVSIGEEEKNLGIKFLIALVTSGALAPIFLYLNQRCDRVDDLKEEEI